MIFDINLIKTAAAFTIQMPFFIKISVALSEYLPFAVLQSVKFYFTNSRLLAINLDNSSPLSIP